MGLDDVLNESSGIKYINAENKLEGTRLTQEIIIHSENEREAALIDESNLQRIREICMDAKKVKHPWPELFLTIASLLIGAFITSLITGIPNLAEFPDILYYFICLGFGIGLGVAWWFKRKISTIEVNNLADRILDLTPNSMKEVNDNEH